MLLYVDRTVKEGSVKSCMFNRVDDARLDTAKAAVAAVVDDTSMKALLCLALSLRFSSLQICITVSSLWCCRPRSIDCLVVPSKQELRPLLQHVQKHVPQLLATYGRDKASRASMSSRRSSASVVAERPNTQPTRHVHAAHVPSTAHATARATAEVPQRHSSVYRSDASQTAASQHLHQWPLHLLLQEQVSMTATSLLQLRHQATQLQLRQHVHTLGKHGYPW